MEILGFLYIYGFQISLIAIYAVYVLFFREKAPVQTMEEYLEQVDKKVYTSGLHKGGKSTIESVLVTK